jgi:hypothetical protein
VSSEEVCFRMWLRQIKMAANSSPNNLLLASQFAGYVLLRKKRLDRMYPIVDAPGSLQSPPALAPDLSRPALNVHDAYFAILPARWLRSAQPSQQLAHAFWTSWPLQLEAMMTGLLGWRFEMQPGPKASAEFEHGSTLVNGLFKVSRPQAASSPVLASFWTVGNVGPLRGGRHVLAVEPLADNKDFVKLWFVSSLAMSPADAANLGTSSSASLELHRMYSRVLFDCAVRSLMRDSVASKKGS